MLQTIIKLSIQKMALPVNAVLEADENYFVLVLKEQLNNEYLFEKSTSYNWFKK